LQYLKNSTATSRGSPPTDLSPPAWSSPPGTLPTSCIAASEIPPLPFRAATHAGEVLLDGVGVDLLRYARHHVVGDHVAHALEQRRQLRPRDPTSSFASNLRNTRSISSFISTSAGVTGAEEDDGAFLGDRDDGMLHAEEEDGEDERAPSLSSPASCGGRGARGVRGEGAALAK
jgi:hypothetical protein